jgi:glycopeptide antibiotics resistance protein
VATTLAPVAWLVLIPTGRRVKEMSERLTGLIPGSDITSSLRYVDSWDSTQLWQMLGNAMMLLPFGAVLPLCVARVQSLSQCAVTVVSVSAGIEFVQLIVPILGRAASFDDILLNSLGGIAGALLTRRWWNTSSAPSTTDELDHSATVT